MQRHAHEQPRERFDEALRRAARFAGSLGRSSSRAEHAHAAASFVIETEADEELAVAAMIHDVSEGAIDATRIRAVFDQFGERVARVVAWCGENGTHPMPPFRGLDEARIGELLCAHRDVLIVAAADTLSAVTTLTEDLRRGPVAAVASVATSDSMRWFLTEVECALRDRLSGHLLTARLTRAIATLEPALRHVARFQAS